MATSANAAADKAATARHDAGRPLRSVQVKVAGFDLGAVATSRQSVLYTGARERHEADEHHQKKPAIAVQSALDDLTNSSRLSSSNAATGRKAMDIDRHGAGVVPSPAARSDAEDEAPKVNGDTVWTDGSPSSVKAKRLRPVKLLTRSFRKLTQSIGGHKHRLSAAEDS